MPAKKSIQERLKDPKAKFSQSEIYQAFEELADQYGFYRDEKLPQKQSVQTTSLVVTGFEDWGAIVVRPNTLKDSMVTVPNLTDYLLGDNLNPSQVSTRNAQLIALAKTVIVSPPDFVDRILASENVEDFKWFNAFFREYQAWMDSRNNEAKEKKPTTGTKSASTSETSETSSPPTSDG